MTAKILRYLPLLLQLCLLPLAPGQSSLDVTVQVGTSSFLIVQGASLPVASDGRDVIAVAVVKYTGSATAQISQITVSGIDFSLISPGLPVTLNPGSSLSFGIRFVPSSGSVATGQTVITFTEASQTKTFSFNLTGTAPAFVFTALFPDGSTASLAPGASINFPVTSLNSPKTILLTVANQGSATGTIATANVTGTDFQATQVPVFPTSVPPGQSVTLGITFNPTVRGTRTGNVSLTLASGSVNFPLQGLAASPDFVLSYTLQVDGNARSLTDGGRLTFAATPALTTAVADLLVVNQGDGPGRLINISLAGAEFRLTGLPAFPQTLNPGQSLRFGVQFSPQKLGDFTGSLVVQFEQRSITAIIQGSTAAPSFAITYIDPLTNNVLSVSDGGTLSFPSTTINTSPSVFVIARNQGPGTGFLNEIVLTGEPFRLLDLPSFPVTVDAGREVRFRIQFSPTQSQQYSASLRLGFSDRSVSISIAAPATGASYVYEVVADGQSNPLTPNVPFPLTATVGKATSLVVTVTNKGDAVGQIGAITVSGAGFQLADLPVLPLLLRANQTDRFTLNFSPAQPGSVTGRLRIGNDSFELLGTAMGPALVYSFTNDVATNAISPNGVVLLAPTRVGQDSSVEFSINNAGNAAAVISTIDLVPSSSVFVLENLPAIPLNLDPDNNLRFSIRFTPNTTGNLTATLRVNNTTFTVSGNGGQPTPLPEYRFDGASGPQQPLQQVGISLTLSSSYPIALRGSLNLSFVSEVFSSNPAVQFATGGRTANFTIPANTTKAIFENGATDIKLQTGTVAGTINVTPTFATLAGLDVTPVSPLAASMTIPRSAPRLLDVRVSNRTLNTVAITVVAFATTRTLRQIDLQIASRDDRRLSNASLTLNIEAAALAWFQGAQSQPFGGLFAISIPLAIQGGGTTEDVVRLIQSITVAVANDLGSSNSLTLAIQ